MKEVAGQHQDAAGCGGNDVDGRGQACEQRHLAEAVSLLHRGDGDDAPGLGEDAHVGPAQLVGQELEEGLVRQGPGDVRVEHVPREDDRPRARQRVSP